MKMSFIGVLILVLSFAGISYAAKDIKTEPVEYKAEGVTLKGFLAYDAAIKGRRPGVLVVHEWWGHNDYARKRARMLAEMGYAALAVDMYGDGKTAEHPEEAGKFSSAVMTNFDTGKARFLAAMDYLKKQPSVDPDKIAAIGYCFGGGVVLNMARQGVDLRGVASFHGSFAAIKPAEKGKVKAKLLVLHGADDKLVPAEHIEAFKKEMKDAGADMTFVSYPATMHSFTNPEADALGKKFNLPLGYSKEADTKSWDELKKFLKKVFRK